tara:strand:- start:170 stop:472 length:303 start_codon:yes stop_codon:yes gene_type:complete
MEITLFLQVLQLSQQLVVVEEVQVLVMDFLVVQVVEVQQQETLTLGVRLQEDQELLVKEILVEQVVLQDHLDLLVVVEVVNLAPEEMEQMLELEVMEELV